MGGPIGMERKGYESIGWYTFFVTLSYDLDRVSSGQGKIREIPDLAKVREKSGNFVEGQGKN